MMASGTGKARGESRVRIRQEHAQGDACAKVQPCRCPCGVSKCVETVSKSMSKSHNTRVSLNGKVSYRITWPRRRPALRRLGRAGHLIEACGPWRRGARRRVAAALRFIYTLTDGT